MRIGVQDSLINRENFLSQCSQFLLTETQAAEILDEVASWEDELRELYSQNLSSHDFNLINMALDGNKLLK
jgi:serine/threonine-protein kinase HipA